MKRASDCSSTSSWRNPRSCETASLAWRILPSRSDTKTGSGALAMIMSASSEPRAVTPLPPPATVRGCVLSAGCLAISDPPHGPLDVKFQESVKSQEFVRRKVALRGGLQNARRHAPPAIAPHTKPPGESDLRANRAARHSTRGWAGQESSGFSPTALRVLLREPPDPPDIRYSPSSLTGSLVKNAAPSISPSRALARRRLHDDRSAPVRDRGDPRPAPGPPGGLRGSPWRR